MGVPHRLALLCSRALALEVLWATAAASGYVQRVTGASLALAHHLTLLLAVWAIYLADHRLDALRVGPRGTPSHRAARRLPPAWGIGLLAAGALASGLASLPGATVGVGLALGGASLAYLMGIRAGRLPAWAKEGAVSLIYTAGLWVAPLLEVAPWRPGLLGLALGFWLLVLGNLLACTALDEAEDRGDGIASLADRLGVRATAWLARGCLAAAGGLGLWLEGWGLPGAAGLCLPCAAQLLLLGAGLGRHPEERLGWRLGLDLSFGLLWVAGP